MSPTPATRERVCRHRPVWRLVASPVRPLALMLSVIFVAGSASALLTPPWPPFADFVWSPNGLVAGEELTLHSTSYDMDGMIIRYRWMLPGEERSQLVFAEDVTTSFPRRGTYLITHEVTDSTLMTDEVTRAIVVANTAPVPDIDVAPSPAYRGQPVTMLGSATDVDGDAIVNWSWDLGDGLVSHAQNASASYWALGVFTISLTARDEVFSEATRAVQLRIVNAPPQIAAHFYREDPNASEVVTFDATGVDPDVAGGVVTFSWSFSDGASYTGAHVVHTFAGPGDCAVTVRGHDADGGTSAPTVLAVHVA